MTNILLDSDVVINILKKKEETLQRLATLDGCAFYLSPIVIAEVYAGARSQEIEQIEALFSFFTVVDVCADVGKLTGKYAHTYKKAFNGISLEDYMIAATAKHHNLVLWTYNKKHYPMKDIGLLE
ncbi:MAG: type II toxin-antitoxin system VapC family toxin [Sulfurovum sp.]|nr:type II toxin-antitoxin system VapC family toxin [Sulfurovum sp.]